MPSHRFGIAFWGSLAFVPVSAFGQILWSEPKPATISDWTWGPGGQELVPAPPFQFVRERLSGTNPKVDVRDAADRRWIVKFGAEVHADTFAPRLLHAVGYAAEPTFFVASGSIAGAHNLKRAKHFISKDGSFHSARFKLRKKNVSEDENASTWSWVENPFTGTRELGGLKILIMLASNWDTKDARNGEGSNNEIIRSSLTSPSWYAVTDWGASFGKSGGFFKRARWDWNGYRVQTADFARVAPDGAVRWGFKGKHGEDISSGVGVEDIRWILPYLSRISEGELRAGLTASGASDPVAQEFARLILSRVEQLQQIVNTSKVQQALK